MRKIGVLLSYPRGVIGGLLTLLVTGFWSLTGILLASLFHNEKIDGWVILNWSRQLLKIFNIQLQVHGRENLIREGGIFIFNHSSHFDIPIIYQALKNPKVRFGAKKELFKIPFFGRAMRLMGMLPIVRSQREEVLSLYRESVQRVKEGCQFCLAPEGTRQRGEKLGKFKSGPFIFAIQGPFRIQPVVLVGASQILPKKKLWPGMGRWRHDVQVFILPPLETKDYTEETRKDLQMKAYELMKSCYEQNKS